MWMSSWWPLWWPLKVIVFAALLIAACTEAAPSPGPSPPALAPTPTVTISPTSSLGPELRKDRWVQVNGPYGGSISDLEKSGNRLWAGTTFTYGLGSNGVFEISEGGSRWEARGGSNASIVDIAVDPIDSDNVAFIDSERGLYLTRNGGGDWRRVDMDVDLFTAVAMSQASPSVIFVGAGTGNEVFLFRSEDYGETWTRSTPLPEVEWSVKPVWAGFSDAQRNLINVIEPHPTEEGTLFVGTNSALFKSEDEGRSWDRVDSTFHRTDVKDITINPHTPDEVYVRVGVFDDLVCLGVFVSHDRELEKEKCAGVYRSPDAGNTWRQLDAYYADPSEGGIFVDEHDPGTAYAIFARLILKTEDGGLTWKEFFSTLDEPFIPNIGVERLVVGDDSSELFIAGRQGLWHSDNGGSDWHERNVGFIGSEVVDIVRAADGTLYAGTYTLGMFKSTDGGANWTFASYRLENSYVMRVAIDPTDSRTIYLTTNGGTYVSHNGAMAWEQVATEFFSESEALPGISHYHGIAVDPEDPNRIYVGGGGDQWTPAGAGISISEDGGHTWRQANVGFQTDVHVSKIVVNPDDPSTVYATTQGPTDFQEKTGSGHGVFKTSDYGATWEKINNGLETVETNTIALDPSDPQVLYLGTDDDGIYKSTDGGTAWSKILIPQLPERYGVGDIVVDPRDGDVVYVATVDYFRLFQDRGLIGDHGVVVSRDGGATWQSFNDGLRHPGTFSLELDSDQGILYTGTRGGGIYWRDVN